MRRSNGAAAFGFALTIVFGFGWGTACESRGASPNIVLIYADDLGWGDVGFNGRTVWKTPNLDRLASRGTIFRRFYTAAVVCAPSRGALLTGKATIHNGVSRNDDDLPGSEVTIAEALKSQGYTTALFGKWHHGRLRPGQTKELQPLDQGFDEFFGFTDAVHAWEKFPEKLWKGREKVAVTGYADDLFTDAAIAFLQRRKQAATPFFLYLPFISAHFTIEAPDDEVALHQGTFVEKDPKIPLRATYAAMITRLDKEVGRIVGTLDELGLTDNTLIVFTSDHGATFEQGNLGVSRFHDSNFPFRGQKRTLYEGGIRVPGVVVWPGKVPAGKVSDEIVHMTDLFPTFLDVAKAAVDPSRKLDGLNVLSAFLGKSPIPERTLFWEWRSEGSRQFAAMLGDFKLVVSGDNRPELFDLATDPAERRNIAAEFPGVVKQLQDQLKSWLATELPEPSSTTTNVRP